MKKLFLFLSLLGVSVGSVVGQTIFQTKPYLQNPFDGITVSWVTNVPVYSWVEYGTDTLNLNVARSVVDGQVLCNNTIHKIRLEDVVPGKKYYYRACSKEMKEYGAYSKKFGETNRSDFYEFTTPSDTTSQFTALIFNDLHKRTETLNALYTQLNGLKYDFVVFNGDCIDDPQSQTEAVGFLKALTEKVGAECVPVFFLRGNHEIRGAYSIGLRDLFDYVGGKTYCSFSWGDTRFVQLDCGEDKPDSTAVYYNLNDFTSLRNDQIDFMRNEFASAPFKRAEKRVLVHHVPVYGNGDAYQPCYALWNPLLQKAPFDLCVNGHTHKFRYYEKREERQNPFPVVVGGGFSLDNATVMVLSKNEKQLTLKVLNAKGEVLLERSL